MVKTYVRKENKFYFWFYLIMTYLNVICAIIAPLCFKILFIAFSTLCYGLSLGCFIFSERFKKGVNVIYV